MGLNLKRQREVSCVDVDGLIDDVNELFLIVDLREEEERIKHGVIPNSIHAPYSRLYQHLDLLPHASSKQIVFYCAAGERSAMAVKLADGSGVQGCSHLPGGFEAWKQAGGATERYVV